MTVEERLDALEKEVQRLRDIEAIKELKGKYFRCLDGKKWDELEETLSPNIVTSYSDGKLVFHGPKEVTTYLSGSMPDTEISLHQGHTPEFWFDSDTIAFAHWYLQDNLIFGHENPYSGTQIQGSAFYTDKYEKIDGRWYILETGYVRVYEEMFQRDDTHKITKSMFPRMLRRKKPAPKKKA